MDYETNNVSKQVNAIQKEIAAKKKVSRRIYGGLESGRVTLYRAGQGERGRARREEEGARCACSGEEGGSEGV